MTRARPAARRAPVKLLLILAISMFAVAAFWGWGRMPWHSVARLTATAQVGQLPASQGLSWKELDDPAKDGWDSEVFSGKADQVLKELAAILIEPASLEPRRLEALVDRSFSCGSLVPNALQTVFQDAVLQVQRGSSNGVALSASQTEFAGPAGLAQALRALTAPVQGARDLHGKLKLFRVASLDDGTLKTVQYVSLAGRLARGMLEQNATWEMRWRWEDSSQPPKLLGIRMTDFELVRSNNPTGPLFSDCTQSILKINDCYQKQFLQGMNQWYERIQDRRYYYLLSQPGLAVGDVNGDGLEDLYVCQDEGLPNRLLVQQPDGSVKDMAKEWGVDWLHSSRGALLVDLDNDGKPDLVVAMIGHIIVAQNMGNRFEIRTILKTDDDTMSLSAVDFNNDGKLDLYVSVYNPNAAMTSKRGDLLGGITMLSDGNRGGHNALFRNGGNWKFTDVTRDVGLEHRRYSFSSCWEDYDQDGWMDLYVASDYGWSQLFRNLGGRFTEVTQSAATSDKGFSMSVAWGDFNQDGWMDLYIGNMFSGAGGRITAQVKYLRDKPALKSLTQRFIRGNTLFQNRGNGTFGDVTEDLGVAMGRWAWSSQFVDLNNDGLEDLVVANGYISTEDSGDL
jgi:hypothetical protein